MTTGRDLVEGVLRKLSVIGRGDVLNDGEAQDVLEVMNQMLSTWSVEGNLVFTESKETFPLVSGQISYTIGAGGDFDTVRPSYLSAVYVSQGVTDYSLRPIDNQQYAQITQKDIKGIPEVVYYDAGYPLARLYLYPVPSSVDAVTIHSFKPLSEIASLNTVVSLPKEYEAAIVYNAALWIAPEYTREASPTVQRIAKQTKDAVQSQNKRNEFFVSALQTPGVHQRYNNDNICSGWWS